MQVNVEVPKGYVIDVEASDLSTGIIRFKKDRVLRYSDLSHLNGYYVSTPSMIIEAAPDSAAASNNKNIFANKQYAESALAFAQLSQVYQHYAHNVDWSNPHTNKYCVVRNETASGRIGVWMHSLECHFFAFETEKEARLFLDNNYDLLRKFFMI